ncbi:MAG: hypothetical protein P4L36_17005 [Holophaga sp.]|nr:hypothetical protein [Holophaga sp.]
MSARSLFQRSCALVGLVVLSAFLFYIGKGHTLLIDTNALTLDGKEFTSADSVNVSIDGKEPESMGRAERSMVQVGGPRHTITIEAGDRKVQERFSVPTSLDTALVSVPAILGGAPRQAWVTRFVAPAQEEAPVEQMQHEGGSPAPAEGTAPAEPAVKP